MIKTAFLVGGYLIALVRKKVQIVYSLNLERMARMADKRMFSKTIVDSDAFLDMPQTTQLLYFHLAMRADDDGFINNPKSIMRNVKCSEDDLKLLAIKKFIIPFESGVVVIKHWKIHNYISTDRYKETKYKEEKATLSLDENKAYTQKEVSYTECIQPVYELDTQVRLGKDRIDKDSIGKISKEQKHKYGAYQHVLLADDEINKLINELGNELYTKCIAYLDEYIEMKGYKAKSHYLCIKKWVVDAVKEKDQKKTKNQQPNDFAKDMEEWANEREGIRGDFFSN